MVDGSGAVMGESNTLLLFDVDPIQGAEFPSVIMTPRGALRGGTTGFDLSFDYVGVGGVDVQFPLFQATWISDWTETVATDAPLVTAATRPNTTLRARPSVTRGATRILASRPFGRDARIAIHDVTGRLLRELRPPEGARTVSWEGTDAAGRLLPAGVYFLRLDDVAGSATTRVTRVR